MGCEKSKSVVVEDKGNFRSGGKSREIQSDTTLFTDIQIDIVRSTWPVVSEDMSGNGVSVFIDIFTAEPAIKKLFLFQDKTGEALADHPLLRAHGLQFMKALDAVCETVSTLGRDCPVGRRLMVLGAQHATIPGFDVVYFGVFSKCLHLTWERALGEEYTEEVKEAWNALFDFVIDRIRDGYALFLEEEERNKAANS